MHKRRYLLKEIPGKSTFRGKNLHLLIDVQRNWCFCVQRLFSRLVIWLLFLVACGVAACFWVILLFNWGLALIPQLVLKSFKMPTWCFQMWFNFKQIAGPTSDSRSLYLFFDFYTSWLFLFTLATLNNLNRRGVLAWRNCLLWNARFRPFLFITN